MLSASREVRAGSRFLRRFVDSILHDGRMRKVSAEMRDMLEEKGVMTQSDVIEQDQVLMDLTHVPHVRDHWQTVLAGQ